MMDYSESRRIIKQAILDNKLVVFAGAGVSVNSGIPLWSEAVKLIHRNLENASIGKDNYSINGLSWYPNIVRG